MSDPVDLRQNIFQDQNGAHPFSLLFFMTIIAATFTYIIPAGQYGRFIIDGRTVIDSQSFTFLDNTPATVGTFFTSFARGFSSSADAMSMVLFAGGAFGILKKTGVLESVISGLVNTLKPLGFRGIAPVVMVALALMVTFTGLPELDLIYISLLIPVCRQLGYSPLTAVSIVLLSSCAGFSAALTNPFFTGIAHSIAELPLYSGMWYRTLCMCFMLTTGIIYVLFKARLAAAPLPQPDNHNPKPPNHYFTPEKRAGVVFLVLFVCLILGITTKGFGFQEISGGFIFIAIATGLAGGLSVHKICEYWTCGCKEILVGVLVIFLARTVMVIMEDAHIIDTIIFYLSHFVVNQSSEAAAVIIYLVQTVINLFIPSGSGQAIVTMPVIVPLSDIGGVTRQVACFASQLGDGITNYIYPTGGRLLAVLAIAGVSYSSWLRFFAPIFLFWFVSALIFVVIAQTIQLGPF